MKKKKNGELRLGERNKGAEEGIAWLYMDAHFKHVHLQPWSLVELNECACFYEWTLVDRWHVES